MGKTEIRRTQTWKWWFKKGIRNILLVISKWNLYASVNEIGAMVLRIDIVLHVRLVSSTELTNCNAKVTQLTERLQHSSG